MTLLILLITFLSTGSTSLVSRQETNPSGTNAESIPTLTVCEALSQAAQYDGKIVQIRGRVYGTDEGTWFFGEECPGIYVTEGKVWPSTIAWTMPTDWMFIIHPVSFSYDWSSDKPVDAKTRQLRKKGAPNECLQFVYTGMFESWSKGKARKAGAKGHWYEFSGFGHLNSAPAQLVLKSADDVEAIPNCKGTSSQKGQARRR